MTERPILFKGEMVRAILDGRKTQTRRAVKPVPTFNGGGACHDADALQHDYVEPHWVFPKICKYGAPGDMLWVREAWRAWSQYDDWPPSRLPPGVDVQYIADASAPWSSRHRSPRYMPRWASRITLHITDIRVERLQDISEDDARAEGCDPVVHPDGAVDCGTRKTTFAKLWNKINGPGAWSANPWVWAISFERVKP
jgi:hypothetical protein